MGGKFSRSQHDNEEMIYIIEEISNSNMGIKSLSCPKETAFILMDKPPWWMHFKR